MRALLLPLVLFVSTAIAFAQEELSSDFLLVGDVAYGMLPPVFVAAGEVRDAKFSGDGSYVYAIRTDRKMSQATVDLIGRGTVPSPDTFEESIVAFNVKTGTSREIYKLRATEGRILSLNPFAGGNSVIVEVMPLTNPGGTLYVHPALLLFASPSKVTVLEGGDYQPFLEVSPIKSKPLIGVVQVVPPSAVSAEQVANTPPPTVTIHFYDINGKLVQSGSVPQHMALTPTWSDDGLVYFSQRERSSTDNIKPRKWFRFNFATGQLEPSANEPRFTKRAEFPLEIRGEKVAMPGTSEDVFGLWLTSDAAKETLLVGSQVNEVGQISPTGDAVVYTSQGIGLLRPIVKLNKQGYLEAMKAKERAKLMKDAKQVALALLMYTADYDDVFPAAGFDMGKEINPYIKNPEVLNRFTYTYSGGSASAMKDPSTTEIGYVQGTGGRAIAYADGHVVWKSD